MKDAGVKAITAARPARGAPVLRREVMLARLALVALAAIIALAFLAPNAHLSDRLALFALALATAVIGWTPLARRAETHRNGLAFFLTAAMFIVYGLARSSGPEEGFSLRFSALPYDEFVIPYSAYVVTLGATLTAPFWWRYHSLWTRSLIAAVTIIALLALFSFSLLRRFYSTGPTATLDPSPLPVLAMKLVEYGCMALLCHAVTLRRETRRLALRFLPVALLLLWARHEFFQPPEETE